MASCEEILAVPGLAFAEMGPGDLSLSLGYLQMPRDPIPEMAEARERIFGACRKNGVAFPLRCQRGDHRRPDRRGGVVISGAREETARAGRAHSGRTMPV